jgi:hypothetical protein
MFGEIPNSEPLKCSFQNSVGLAVCFAEISEKGSFGILNQTFKLQVRMV